MRSLRYELLLKYVQNKDNVNKLCLTHPRMTYIQLHLDGSDNSTV